MRRLPLALAAAAVAGSFPGAALGAGFQLMEQNASGLGTAFAGSTTLAEDASTIFFNPAGLVYLDRQVAAVGSLIRPSARFRDQGSTNFLGQPATGGDGGDAGGWAAVPAFYYAQPLGPRLSAGLGINSPYGLRTRYDADFQGRFQALKSDLRTININPSLAYRATDRLSVGIGFSAQYSRAELTRAIDLRAACFQALGPAACTASPALARLGEGSVRVKGSDWSFGWNLGVLYDVSDATRVGFAYRSRIRHSLDGTATFGGIPAPFSASPSLGNSGARADLDIPDSWTLGVVHRLDPKWTLMGDVSWTHWSRFKELSVRFDNGAPASTIEQNWRNTWRLALGVTYQYAPALKLRGGLAFDQSPVPDATLRIARVPDERRIWLSLGAGYRIGKAHAIDVGYAHLFVKDARIDHAEPGSGTLVGQFRGSANILAAQYTYRF